jgi:hypothetical protein
MPPLSAARPFPLWSGKQSSENRLKWPVTIIHNSLRHPEERCCDRWLAKSKISSNKLHFQCEQSDHRAVRIRALLDRNVKWQGAVPVFEPFERNVLTSFFGGLLVKIRHENLEASLRSHASVAVDELSLVVDEVEVKPGILRSIDHRKVDVVHGELPEVERAPVQTQKVVPLCEAGLVGARVAVDHFEVWCSDKHGGKLTVNVRRGKQFLCVEDNVVVHDLTPGILLA